MYQEIVSFMSLTHLPKRCGKKITCSDFSKEIENWNWFHLFDQTKSGCDSSQSLFLKITHASDSLIPYSLHHHISHTIAQGVYFLLATEK
jgi:hypothetical protein